MRTFVPGLIVFGAFVSVGVIGAIAFFVAGKLVPPVDASANGAHLTAFIVAITGVTVAVASAFPIFVYAVPWVAVRVERAWPQRPPELSVSTSYQQDKGDISGGRAGAGPLAGS